MDRSLWTRSLSKVSCPPWPCPVCGSGTLALVPKTLRYEETAISKRQRIHEDWDPDWIETIFTAWAKCRHPSCNHTFVIAGNGGLETVMGPEGIDYDEYFSPMICHPMPNLINIPKNCPDEIKTELGTAFALFWAHRAACAGRIRVALEYLMDFLKIPKKKKKGKRFRNLSLHNRIDAFAKKQKILGPELMALKWLGNTGSHTTGVSRGDLLDAFEIMEHVLDEIINKRSEKISKMSKNLTKKHSKKSK